MESPTPSTTPPARLALLAALTVGVGTLLGLGTMEIALRAAKGELLSTRNLRGATRTQADVPGFRHDSRLGHVPLPGHSDQGSWSFRIDARGLRTHGPASLAEPPLVLAVGDSFTMGDEVDDAHTWPAHFERQTRVPVANAGVSAYGMDQAVLRAESYLAELRPRLVVLGVISADIHRCELSHRSVHKPWFEIEQGALALRGVPVPSESLGSPDSWLGRSYLAHALMRRIAPDWWHLSTKRIAHEDGNAVAAKLLTRLDTEVRIHGGELVLLTLAGAERELHRLPPLLAHASEIGVEVVDLATDIVALADLDDEGMFRPGGHLSNHMNEWVAERLSTALAPRMSKLQALRRPVVAESKESGTTL